MGRCSADIFSGNSKTADQGRSHQPQHTLKLAGGTSITGIGNRTQIADAVRCGEKIEAIRLY